MNKDMLCCDECFKHIAEKSSRSAALLLDLCEIYEEDEVICIEECFENTTLLNCVAILEKEGYLVSTDTPESIVFKLLHVKNEKGELFFCTC